ncbi:MAG TPA: hypothetical protein VMR70_15255, partial [Flavisolibacter sp.]|nr:hypothetical protein [Flavisolibacter sp.]
ITGNEQGKRAISHNLHEGLAQSVASSIFYLDAVGEDAQKNNVLLQQAKKQMQQVLNEVRNLSHRISPPGLSILSAGELVKEFIEKSTAAYPFSITVYEKDADRTLQPEILLTGIRMLEEWLGMLAIHTKPASVMVKIQCRQRLLITISDDDTALQKEEREKQALQFSFADRAESLGGEVVLSQTKAGHHAICFSLPLQLEAQPAVKSFSALVG